MIDNTIHMRMKDKTKDKLKILADYKDWSMSVVVEQLIRGEYERLEDHIKEWQKEQEELKIKIRIKIKPKRILRRKLK